MAIEFVGADQTTWKDNTPVYRQLWVDLAKLPGFELDLTSVAGRLLTVQWFDRDELVYVDSELLSISTIRIINQKRGVIGIFPNESLWVFLRQGKIYRCVVRGYGLKLDEFEFRTDLPEPGRTILNGVEVYASPRSLLTVLGAIPGAIAQTGVDLSDGWTLDERGYWVKEVPSTQRTFGLWLNDLHVRYVKYSELALAPGHAWARVGGVTTDTHRLYLKTTEDLSDLGMVPYIETAFSNTVLGSIQQATAEIHRKTGTFFNLQRIVRQSYDGSHAQRQVVLEHHPIRVDESFCLRVMRSSTAARQVYTESDIAGREVYSKPLKVDADLGVITLKEAFWEWNGYDDYLATSGALISWNTLPKGESNLEVTYVAGYDRPPSDIAEACAMLAAIRQGRFWLQTLSAGMGGVSVGCVNLNFSEAGQMFPIWQSSAESTLQQYTSLLAGRF